MQWGTCKTGHSFGHVAASVDKYAKSTNALTSSLISQCWLKLISSQEANSGKSTIECLLFEEMFIYIMLMMYVICILKRFDERYPAVRKM